MSVQNGTSGTGDDLSPSCLAAAAATASQHLSEMSLSAEGSRHVDRQFTESCSTSVSCDKEVTVDPTDAAIDVAGSHTRCWTSTGFAHEPPDHVVSDHLPSPRVTDRLTSVDNDRDKLSVESTSNQHISTVISGSDSASVNHVNHCEAMCNCCQDSNESLSVLTERTKLFSCSECTIICSKHLAADSLHIVLDMFRHSEVDCSVFGDALLVVVQNEIYLTKVIRFLMALLSIVILTKSFRLDRCVALSLHLHCICYWLLQIIVLWPEPVVANHLVTVWSVF